MKTAKATARKRATAKQVTSENVDVKNVTTDNAVNLPVVVEERTLDFSKVNKADAVKLERLAQFKEGTNSSERLKATTAKAHVSAKGLNACIKQFLTAGELYLTTAQRNLLTFAAIRAEIAKCDKLKDKPLFNYSEIERVCRRIIRNTDENTRRAERAAKQQAKADKK